MVPRFQTAMSPSPSRPSAWRSQATRTVATVIASAASSRMTKTRRRNRRRRRWISVSFLSYLSSPLFLSSSSSCLSFPSHRPTVFSARQYSSMAFSLSTRTIFETSPPRTASHLTTIDSPCLPVSSALWASSLSSSATAVTETSVNDSSEASKIDNSFNPDVIDELVKQRMNARWDGDYDRADDILQTITSHPSIPRGYEIQIEDVPRDEGGTSSWSFQPIASYHHRRLFATEDNYDETSNDENVDTGPTILQLAHAALGLAVHTSSTYHLKSLNSTTTTPPTTDMSKIIERRATQQLQALVEQAHDRLDKIYSLHDNEHLYKDRSRSLDGGSTDDTGKLQKNEPSLLTRSLLRYELGGRIAADAAFWFALAGIDESSSNSQRNREPLLERLASVAAIELERYGFRQKRREKDLLQIIERFAAAGVRHHPALEKVVSDCLQQKKQQELISDSSKQDNNEVCDEQHENEYSSQKPTSLLRLHSDHSLFRLWKFSTRQKKQWAFLNAARKHWESQFEANELELELDGDEDAESSMTAQSESADRTTYDWDETFDDTSRPLVIDIGCGMGVSLLGLASDDDGEDEDSQLAGEGLLSSLALLNKNEVAGDVDDSTSPTTWSDCNFVGVDLGLLGLRYARGVSKRFGIEDRLHFACCPAEEFIQKLESYPGPIRLCMVQFPTPYRLDSTKGGGNSQLPSSQSDGFMVSKQLLQSIHSSLHPYRGRLLVQSNCEDVAVWMRKTAENDVHFSCLETTSVVDLSSLAEAINDTAGSSVEIRLPQRTIDWRNSGGEEPTGPGWFQGPILPRSGRPETEVACRMTGTPIYRCIFEAN